MSLRYYRRIVSPRRVLAQDFDFSDVHPPRDPTPAPDTRDHDDLFANGLIKKEEWHRREFYPLQQPQFESDDSESQADAADSESCITDWYPTGPTANPCDIFNEHHRRLHRLAAVGLTRSAHFLAVTEPNSCSAAIYAFNDIDLTVNNEVQKSDTDTFDNDSGIPPRFLGQEDEAHHTPLAETDQTSTLMEEDVDPDGLKQGNLPALPLSLGKAGFNVHCEVDPYDYALVCPLRDENGNPCKDGLFAWDEFDTHLFFKHIKFSPWICTLSLPPTKQICGKEMAFPDDLMRLAALRRSKRLRDFVRHVCAFGHRNLLVGCRIHRTHDGVTWTPVEEIGSV
ncbi:hypothetical protein H1R20_g9163, partial [Candolleomyces eurysporus]